MFISSDGQNKLMSPLQQRETYFIFVYLSFVMLFDRFPQ